MATSYGYASSAHQGVHFGLGKLSRVAELEILWPSGARQKLEDVGVNQELRIEEP
jgi:hypothetical protein